MMKFMKMLTIALCAVACVAVFSLSQARAAGPGPVVVMETTSGVIMLMLDEQNAPVSVKNFMAYVDKGFYDGTVFHRVIKGFMIQGGGMDTSMRPKRGMAPIKNESGNGLKNKRGTIAMARTMDLNSATSQFFINHVDNGFLDKNQYAVFGKVIRGMDVVDKIAQVPTGRSGGMDDVPRTAVIIKKCYRHQG